MQDRLLYEYAVIRIVPRVEREEFVNAGVILYVHQTKFLDLRYHMPEARLGALDGKADQQEICSYLAAFERICRGCGGSGPIGALDAASRFRWLTATRSTVVQTSKVHTGFCQDPKTELERLFDRMAR